MPFIRRRVKPFSLEHVAQMAAAVAAHDLGPRHAKGAVLVPRHGAREAVKVGRPAAPRVELVRGLVQRRVAAGTGVHARRRVVLVELAGAGGFGALFAEDAELFWILRVSLCHFVIVGWSWESVKVVAHGKVTHEG